MKDTAFWFFALAVICVTTGMVWGIQMAASGDHALLSAHAHLNLVGWVTMGLFGLYYRATPAAGQGGLARIHLALAAGGVALMVPGIAIAVSGGGEILAIIGSLVTLASMLVFLVTVFRHGLGQPA